MLAVPYLMEAVREGDGVRKVKKERERQLRTGGKAALSLRTCEVKAEEGHSVKLAGRPAGWLALTLPLWLSAAAANRRVKAFLHVNGPETAKFFQNDYRVSQCV